ncbi:DNA topoisomerase III [Mammaliicoccus sciuri]|uniref:DNA topoisomerase III n=1 Tax=Mammaliicoccus sciuri TaxID=1296 RepID=UPI000D1F06E3|nr:DNA topoisomerase III [Mammaliicoccus sciuri]MCD8789848.1 DNA topoisomerase III [Mammaliicoccus sciuri]MCJ0917659.1 DNA topoisomerase III [Mammaliicoccus sciuri]MCJ0938304.1 DNA topoisomerase III [Mammaliicoccus sciuri]MEB6248512.1 DNA topoisomerase III [Mammaliicoccus sciuri]PTJ61522.1 DNA topoisomerase III [Mammaliicoccus sciuri]
MKALVLAEKPSVGRDIAKALGIHDQKKGYFENKNYIVTWALGHLVTNATPEEYDKKFKEWNLNVLPIIPDYMKHVVIKKTRSQFNTVQHLMKRDDVNSIIIATDAGREGELVARLIIEKAKVKKQINRLWISSVTEKAIKAGFQNLKPGEAYNNLYQAALCRSEADWIVGINATRALTTKYDAQLSCGRVQTPTLNLVQMRQQEIQSFKPEKYYQMNIEVEGYKFKWLSKSGDKTFDSDLIEQVKQKVQNKKGIIQNISKKKKTKYPQKLYDLTSLQQTAYQRYKMSAKETLNTMQALYEQHKVLTYPRTDSNYLTDDMVSSLKERVSSLSATPLKSHAVPLLKKPIKVGKHFVDNKKVSDHHAIVPTEVRPNFDQLSPREQKIYMLVAERFLEVLLPPYQYEETTVTLTCEGETFKLTQEVAVELGFKELYEEKTHVKVLPFEEQQHVNIQKVNVVSKDTEPPAYFNEGTLLKAMESPHHFFKLKDKKLAQTLNETGGIGTVATRADIIEKLYSSNVIESVQGKIKITPKGKQLLNLAPEQLTSPELTADWEMKLTQIEKGNYSKNKFMDEMRNFTREIITDIKESDDKFKHDNITTTECPTCGKFMLKVKTKNGQMLVCQDPTCKTKKNQQRQTNARCPNCKKKLTLYGTGKKATYRCVCGHTETQEHMDERLKNRKSGKIGKKEMKKYMQTEEVENNPFKDALKGLKF